ncbi:MAG: DUF58 domain-containing protein, partial [Bacteroidota bacterium]
ETNLRCQLVVDVSSSMLFPGKVNPTNSNEWNKLKFALYSAASVMELMLRQRDAVGLSLFDRELSLHTKASSSQAHVRYLYSELETYLAQVNTSYSSETHVSEILHEIAERTHKRSMVVIFSDMLEDQRRVDDIFNALQHLRHNKHEVLLFQIVHQSQEVDFNFENRPTTFVDLESGKEIKLHPHEVRKIYLEKMANFKADLKLKAGQIGVDYFEANMEEGVQAILLQFLLKRQRMLV